MGHKFAEIAFTETVREIQELMGSRKNYARLEAGPTSNQLIGPNEEEFILQRDSFYLATVSETGWPYIQHRGGPIGFLRILPENEIGFADFSGNRQYISVGNVENNNRIALIIVDYPNRARLKIFGRTTIIDRVSHPEKMSLISPIDYKANVERGFIIKVEAFDWNCPQHITPRWTAEDIQTGVAPLRERLQLLEEENKKLKLQVQIKQSSNL